MDNSQPAVSVIIPCFNQGATLDDAVASVLDQTFTDFEIVIVDDGSTDPFTRELLANYHRPRTRVIVTANEGLAAARNTAIRNSRGKYVLPLDADDRIAPEYLARAVPVLDADPDALIVHCNVERFGDETGLVELPEFSLKTMLFRNLIFCCALFRRSDYDETGGYKENVYEDWDLWLSLMELRPAGRVFKIPETLFFYRIRSNSMLASMADARRRLFWTNLFLNHTALYEAHGVDPITLYAEVEQLEVRSRRLESEYREIRSSAEYKLGSFLLNPFDSARAAMAREAFYRLKRLGFSRNVPALKAIPNPVRIDKQTGVGETTLSWWPGSAQTVEIHVNAPDGPLFVRTGEAGNAVTGRWVRDGMTFYLQDVSDNLPLTASNTLATARIDTASFRRGQTARSGLILMYHRITTGRRDPWQLNVSPQHFREHLDVLRRHYRPWPLGRALQALRDGKLPARTVVVTFDDGYRDNFLNAKPLLENRDVPATLFLTSGYIESHREFWWDEMAGILSQQKLSPASLDSVYRRLQAMTDVERRTALDDLCGKDGMPVPASVAHPVLSREEVAAFDKSRLVEVGSHTATHPLLTALPLHHQREEIVRGKRELEEIVGHPVTSFAYPHGQYSAATMKLVEEAGFACGCSTDAGIVTSAADRFRLPRIQVTDCDGEEFARRVSDWFANANPIVTVE